MSEISKSNRLAFGLSMAAIAVGVGLRTEVAKDLHNVAEAGSDCIAAVFEGQECDIVDTLKSFEVSTSIVIALAGSAVSAAGISMIGQTRRANIFQPTHSGFRR